MPIEGSSSNKRTQQIAYILLFSTTILWGTTFIITKTLTQVIPIFWVTAMRHSIALIGLVPLLPRLHNLDKRVIWMGLFTGGANFFALILQTYGLQTISSGKSAFLTGLYVILVPFMSWILYKKKLRSAVWVAAIIAFIGMTILVFSSNEGESISFQIQTGDLLTIACALLFAVQIILTEKYSPLVDSTALTIMQLLWITIFAFIFVAIFQPASPFSQVTPYLWLIWLFLGLAATTLPFFFQNWGQKYVEATPATIIFALEPVFATIFGFLIGNEPITWTLLLGGGLIFMAIIIAAKSQTNAPAQQS